MADQSTNKGEVREELQITFEQTVDRITGLIDKVEALSDQAEGYFWASRIEGLRLYEKSLYKRDDTEKAYGLSKLMDTDVSANGLTGAGNLVLAAVPMLNEILERLAYVADETFEDLGTPIDETGKWTVATATRTFYNPIAKSVCNSLRSIIDQAKSWADTAKGWDDLGAIRDIYGDALTNAYTKARTLINQLGPLFAPVLCNYTPFVTDTSQITGNVEKFYPTSCAFTPLDTHRVSITISAAGGAYTINPRILIGADYEDWQCVADEMSNGENVFQSRGGLLAIEQMIDSDGDTKTGVYEILEITDDAIVVSNENMSILAFESEIPDAVGQINFLLRLIRKTEAVANIVHVQYRAQLLEFDFEDESVVGQNYSWEFDEATNSHIAPELVSIDDNIPVWTKYTASGPEGGTNFYPGSLVENVSENTLVIAHKISNMGFNNTVYCFALDEANDFLYVGGKFTAVGGEPRKYLCRFVISTGILDSWAPTELNDYVRALAVDTSGNLWVGGYFTEVNSDAQQNYLTKYDYDAGTLTITTTFVSNLVSKSGSRTSVKTIVVYDGRVYVGGDFSYVSIFNNTCNMVYDESTELPLWTLFTDISGGYYYNSINVIFVVDDGIVVAGDFTSLIPTYGTSIAYTRNMLAHFTWDGTGWTLSAFIGDTLMSFNKPVYCIAHKIITGPPTESHIYIGGVFTSVDSTARKGFVKFVDGVMDSFNPAPDVAGIIALALDGSYNLYVAGLFSKIASNSIRYLAMFDSSDIIDTGFNLGLNGCVYVYSGVVIDGDDFVYVGGGFTEVDSSPILGGFRWDGSVVDTMPGDWS